MKPLPALLATLLVAVALAGCTQTAATTVTTTLHVDFAGARPAVDAAVKADLLSHPASSLYGAHHAAVPAFYTAFDQLVQWSHESGVPVEADYSPQFGFFLSTIDGKPSDSPNAFWALSVNGTESPVGMDQVRIAAGSRISWTLASYTPPAAPGSAGSDPGRALSLAVPAVVTTRSQTAQLNGTTSPGAHLSFRGPQGVLAQAANGTWTYRVDVAYGRTNLTVVADDGHATRQANVTLVRLASLVFEAKYTMAVPPHPSSSDPVWYDPDERASATLYAQKGASHPPFANVHDVMVSWTRQTGLPVDYGFSDSLGFSVLKIDGVGAPLSSSAPPYWCYKVDGKSADLGITLEPATPGSTITWEFAGCT
jgi:hypothetical protein